MIVIDSIPLPVAPTIGGGVGTKYERELAAFRRLLPFILSSHLGEFVAVHDGQVVAHGRDRVSVVGDAFSKVGNVAIHVGFVGPETAEPMRSGVRRDLTN